MKNILIIGVGGTGSNAVDMLYQKIQHHGMQTEGNVISVVFDTDADGVQGIKSATAIPMTDPSGLGAVCDRIGEENLREWFPYNVPNVRTQELTRGASQWRKKSYLAFMNLMNNMQKRSAFHQALESLRDTTGAAQYEVYVVASIAGGTGSGSFIPITLYAKKYLREVMGVQNIQCSAMLACPDIYADAQTPDNRTKVYANAYAILRELNAISQVVHGSNDPNNKDGNKTPIHFRIGHENSPVGLLFDSDKREFWSPEAAPFERVFMLDKIPGLSSIAAHDTVLANALYTIVCTQVGTTVDSEVSNHAILLTQNDGHNAIYAGVGTAEVHYPTETILSYLAHQKTVEDSEGSWLLIHKETEEKIAEEARIAREARRVYMLKDGEYAAKWLASAESEIKTPTSEVPEIIRRGTTFMVQDGDKVEEKSTLIEYWEDLRRQLEERLPAVDDAQNEIVDQPIAQSLGLFASKSQKDGEKQKVVTSAQDCYDILNAFYGKCVDVIRNYSSGIINSILPLSKEKDPLANPQFSFALNVLSKDGKYIHPIAAMNQLCAFKVLLKEHLSGMTAAEWKDVASVDPAKLPVSLLNVTDETAGKTASEAKKSAYIKVGSARFANMLTEGSARAYVDSGTDPKIDSEAVINDAKEILDSIRRRACDQLLMRVLKAVSSHLDALIAQYRTFFSRFAEERETLKEATLTALKTKSGVEGAVMNLYSSVEDKQKAYAAYKKEGGVVSQEQLLENDNVTGKGVFETVYEIAALAAAEESDAVSVPKNRLAQIFDAMVEANKVQISKDNYFAKIATKCLFEIIADNAPDDVLNAEKKALVMAYELAKPALQPDNYKSGPKPAEITVFLVSADAARYLKKNSDKFKLNVPVGASEGKQLFAVAEEFVKRMSPEARIAVVEGIPSNVLYITREIVDIQPTHIKKIDEMSSNPAYYEQYKKAIEKMESTGTDMWNPHLSFNLHKRGYLPFINVEKERESDRKLMKALLYAIMTAKISYRAPLRQERGFRYNVDGVETLIMDERGTPVTEKNLSGLITWLRPQDALIEKWYEGFENDVRNQLEDLRPVYSNGDIPRAEADITKAPYMVKMRENLFEEIIAQAGMGAEHNAAARLSLNLFEFYNKIKCSEDVGFDCNDAEKILDVGYDTLCRFCEKCVSSEKDPGNYLTVYEWQIEKFMIALCKDADIIRESDPLFQATRLISMVNEAGYFKSIDRIVGRELTYRNYVLSDAAKSASASVLREIEASKKASKAEAAPVTEAPAAPEAPATEESAPIAE